MKRISTVLAVILSTSASAALALTTSNPNEVTVPQLSGGFEITGGALYWNTTNNDLNYQTLKGNLNTTIFSQMPLPAGIQTIDPGYNWGFLVGVGYIFPNSGNDVQANWVHLGTGTVSGPTIITSGAAVAVPGITPGTVSTISNGNAKFNTDVVNLNVGQFIDVGNRLQTRLYAGLQYGDLEKDFDTAASYTYSDTLAPNIRNKTVTVNQTTNAKFQGVGPELGINARYSLIGGLGLVGDVSTALLIGESKTGGQLNEVDTDTALPPTLTNIQNTQSSGQTRVVPDLDAKLGLDYSHALGRSVLTLTAGYEVAQYFNVFDRVNSDAATELMFNPNVIFSGFTPNPLINKESDLSFQGPYASLTVIIN